MAEYRLRKPINKKQLLKNGFIYRGDDTYVCRRTIYNDLMSLVITVFYDREEEEYWMNMRFVDDNNGLEYSSCCLYGRNEFLERLLKRRQNVLKPLIRKGIIEAVK